MFTWVGAQFNSILSTYVLGVVSALMTAIAPIALTAMTVPLTLSAIHEASLSSFIPKRVTGTWWEITLRCFSCATL